MPDPLTHYLASYLISSRIAKPKYSLLIALAGLLPDIDVVFRIHRWVTHSLIIVLATLTPALLDIYTFRREYLRLATLTTALYALHIALDTLTAPTPALWPLTQSIQVRFEVTGTINSNEITIKPIIDASTKPTDFTQKTTMEGPLITEASIILAIITAAITLAEYLAGRKRK
jgi:membrane-bound metal-dependent hydrolase YbcI (DUF457 family)